MKRVTINLIVTVFEEDPAAKEKALKKVLSLINDNVLDCEYFVKSVTEEGEDEFYKRTRE